MAQVLSQEKINRILITVNGASGAVINRPAKFPEEQLQAVSYIHETFANLTACCLTDLLRSMCHVHVSSADELTYEEFIRSVPPPSTLAEINMNPLKGSAILEISHEITFVIIDRICGGSGDRTKFQHELTDIDC